MKRQQSPKLCKQFHKCTSTVEGQFPSNISLSCVLKVPVLIHKIGSICQFCTVEYCRLHVIVKIVQVQIPLNSKSVVISFHSSIVEQFHNNF